MKAVVMAGGEGARLRPVTMNRPKPVVPIGNEPIMGHILTLLKRHGIEEVVATVHYLADEVKATFGDGTERGMRIEYSLEETPLGTAGSVRHAKAFLGEGTFLIVSGDALTDCDLTAAIRFHREKGSFATIVLSRVENPLDFGVVVTDGEGRIQRFFEKPSWSEVFSDTVNTGIYILEPEVLDGVEPDKMVDWSADVFPRLMAEGKPLYGYVMQGYWSDIGSLGQYREAQEHLLGGRIDLPKCGEERSSGVFLDEGCNVDPNAELVPPVCLGKNVKVKRGARIGPFATIGDNSIVEEDARVERSVVWDSVYLGPSVSIRSAIVGTRATIKRDSVVHEDAVVGDRCLLDVGCLIRPRVKLWPDKIIERGSTVTMSLVWGSKWRGALFRELGVAGLSNVEITPDFAVRLGSAFGSTLPQRGRVVTSRDSARSSVMAKRALISALLSTGCDVLDLRSAAAPVARHFIKASGAVGAMQTRKLPGNVRVTLIEMFDARGAYLSKAQERKVENAFFREEFRRADPDDLGEIEYGLRAIETYQDEYFRCLPPFDSPKPLRIVVDYGYSPLATFYPAMLVRLGVESLSLNAFNDARRAPRTPEEVGRLVENVREIVNTLGYDMGMVVTEEGERLTVVDDSGRTLDGHRLFGAVGMLAARTHDAPKIAVGVAAPDRLVRALESEGVRIVRTKADPRSLMNAALDEEVTLAGDERGGFIFPEMHPGYDAPFAFGKLLWMLQRTGLRLSEAVEMLPELHLAYEQVACPWEAKGAVMRQLSEEARDGQVETLDGIKVYDGERWALVLPDAVEPLFHVYAEAEDERSSRDLATEYARKVEAFRG